MEVHAAPAVGKRLWSYVRAAFFMARNGVLSNKRKLLLSMHLLGANKRRGTKAVARAVATLLTHHGPASAHALRRRDYEFSCSNSPADPAAAASSSSSSSSRRRLAYFPCLGAVADDEEYQYDGYGSRSLPDADADADAEPVPPRARIEYYAAAAASSNGDLDLDLDLAPEEEEYACASASASPALLLPGTASGEFSVRVSNYSSEDEAAAGAGGSDAVDAAAEEFIRRFYDQLRRQNTVALLGPYYMQQESVAAA